MDHTTPPQPATTLPPTLTTALKEWAVVQRALLEGHQILLLRKGGIAEDTGEFDLRARQFLIYPNYAHETEREGDVQPRFLAWLREEEDRKPYTGQARIETAVEVTDVARVDAPARLVALMSTHIWTEKFIQGRFDWETYKPVFALILRAYRLAAPVILPILREYGGCRSWIEMAAPIPTDGATPALDQERFESLRAETLGLLAA